MLLRGSQRLQVPKVASPLNCEVCVAQSGALQVRGALRSEVLCGCSVLRSEVLDGCSAVA